MKIPVIAFVLSIVLTTVLTPLVRTLAFRFGAVAHPRERDVHQKPLPRWGGLAMYGGFLLTLGIVTSWILTHRATFPWSPQQLNQYYGVILGATIVAVVGTIDDKFEISALWQSAGLIAAGAVLVVFGVRIEGMTNPFTAHEFPLGDPRTWIGFPAWASAVFTVVWVFGVSKTVDFIDGLDGLAAGVCAICGATLAIMSAIAAVGTNGQYEVTILAAAMVGACLGFLRYNYNPASIIMGTVGAQFLGFVLASLSIIGTIKIAAAVSIALPLIVLGVPIFDGIRVVTQRTINRTPAYLPDKTSHIHHLLINKGLSQRRAVWVIYGLTACFCALALVLFRFGR